MAYLNPYIMSMVTDTNQYGYDLTSCVTDDVDVELTLPGPANGNTEEKPEGNPEETTESTE
ncbi:MAG: hypothetical protein IJ607_08240 [Bacteroidaceae bacterium]|nr:hypothetical protein [Bacteroidaceae bacterium]